MNDLPILNQCVNRLMGELESRKWELRLMETSQCNAHNVEHNIKRTRKLRQQIASIETRLRRAEKLQEAALARPDGKNK